MKWILVLLILAIFVFNETTVTDTAKAEHQVTVSAYTKRPRVRYAPNYQIQINDTIEVAFFLNGNETKRYKYINTIIPSDTTHCLLFIGKLAIIESNK